MHYFDKDQVIHLLDMQGCISTMKNTLKEYSAGNTVQVLRTAMSIAPKKILGIMPAASMQEGIAGAKIITVFPDNFRRGLPSHQGIVVLFDADTGSLNALVDGEAITGIRTAAISAAVTEKMSRSNSHTLCLLGSGLQARRHLEAISLVREITQVRVWDINESSVLRFKEEMEQAFCIPVINCCHDIASAVRGSDIICTVTAAHEPILLGEHVLPGTHINAVGACGPINRELDTALVQKARFFCDSIESCMNEAGDFLIPLHNSEICEEHLLGEVGAVFSGNLEGRISDNDITIFEAQGLAVEDLAAANYILKKYYEKEDTCHDRAIV